MSLKDEMNQEAENYGAGGSNDFFRFSKSGVFKIRLLTKPVALATHFFGKGQPSAVCYGQKDGCPFHRNEDEKPSLKFIAYVLDRATGKISLGELPWSVVSAVADLEEDEDYAFKSYPMEYDIKITVDKDAAPADMYKTMPSPTKSEITPEEATELKDKYEKLTPESFVEKRKDKQLAKHKEDGTWEREQKRREEVQAGIEEAKENAKGNLEYPEEELNPGDIPF